MDAVEPRDEVQPVWVEYVQPGPARDSILFYHRDATSQDTTPLWDYGRFILSNLVWVNDHFIVTPNPRFLQADASVEGRFARVLNVLRRYFRAKVLVNDLPTNAIPPLPNVPAALCAWRAGPVAPVD